jgi:putative DNA primase/helicase
LTDLSTLEPGEHRITCPSCGRGQRDKTFGVTVDYAGAAVGHCFRCEYVETYRPNKPAAHRLGKAVSLPVVELKRQTLSDYGAELFDQGTSLRGTVGENYLRARGCVIPPDDGDVRFHPALRHPSGLYAGPALVALVTHAETKVPMTLHRTWIRPDGTKADCDPPRMLLGGHSKKHGVIRLWPDDSVTLGLGIAEGIETALSLAHAYRPAWACIDAGNLAALPVLAGIETLIIAADNDDAGQQAARACATRWHGAGREVRIVVAPDARADLNDVVMGPA